VTEQELNDRIQKNALHLVEVASQGFENALDQIAIHQLAQQKAASLAPSILQTMLEGGLIPVKDKEAAAAMLGSHAETMSLLKNACDDLAAANALIKKAGLEKDEEDKKLKTKQASEIGSPVPETPTSTKSSNQNGDMPYLIGSRGDGNRASDLPLLNLANIPH